MLCILDVFWYIEKINHIEVQNKKEEDKFMTGIIDIGSNTVRLVVYDKRRKVSNTALASEILSDTYDGVLSSPGIEKLCNMIEFLKGKAGNIEVHAFATFAFRILKNREEVKQIIFERTGISIDILSGEDEARYDFYGLKSSISKNESGIGVDLGGGSAQIFEFKEGNMEFGRSYPIGCKKVKNKFLKHKFPNSEERKKIEEYIEEKIEEIDIKCEKIYMMGGTAKTAAKLYSFLKGTENINVLKTNHLDDLVTFIEETPENVMKNILKNRYDNIVVGIIIMKKIADICGAGEIHIKKCGVRDGYLRKIEESIISK